MANALPQYRNGHLRCPSETEISRLKRMASHLNDPFAVFDESRLTGAPRLTSSCGMSHFYRQTKKTPHSFRCVERQLQPAQIQCQIPATLLADAKRSVYNWRKHEAVPGH